MHNFSHFVQIDNSPPVCYNSIWEVIIINRYPNLMCVKSIMTIVLTVTLAVLAILYPDRFGDTLKDMCYIVVTFYFTHQINKRDDKKGDEHEGN